VIHRKMLPAILAGSLREPNLPADAECHRHNLSIDLRRVRVVIPCLGEYLEMRSTHAVGDTRSDVEAESVGASRPQGRFTLYQAVHTGYAPPCKAWNTDCAGDQRRGGQFPGFFARVSVIARRVNPLS